MQLFDLHHLLRHSTLNSMKEDAVFIFLTIVSSVYFVLYHPYILLLVYINPKTNGVNQSISANHSSTLCHVTCSGWGYMFNVTSSCFQDKVARGSFVLVIFFALSSAIRKHIPGNYDPRMEIDMVWTWTQLTSQSQTVDLSWAQQIQSWPTKI